MSQLPLPGLKARRSHPWLIGVLLLTATLALTTLVFSQIYRWPKASPLLSPLSQTSPKEFTSPKLKKTVLGFVPYWLIADVTPNQNLTHLAYFGIEFDGDGNLLTRYADGAPELGWSRLDNSQTVRLLAAQKALGSRTLLTLKALDKDIISSLVSSQPHRNTAISHTLNLINEYDFDGIIIDLEYAGTPPQSLKTDFTTFVSQLTTTLRRERPQAYTALAVFADSASKNRLWELEPLSRFVDHVIIMAYDFHRPTSPQAGPVAPLYGGCQAPLSPNSARPSEAFGSRNGQIGSLREAANAQEGPTCQYTYDITQAVSDFSLQVPPEKLLLGIPFYGYQWRVTSPNPFATTYSDTGALASIGRVTNLLINPEGVSIVNRGWDEQALSPYLVLKEHDETHVIWYENELSLGYKFDLVNTAGLGGIAIWAIGYEGENTQPWDLIGQKFAIKP